MAVSILMGIAMSAVSIVLAIVLVAPIYGDETADLVLVATPCFLMGAIMAVPMSVLRRRLDFARLSIIELASTLIRLGATVGFALSGMDASALVVGYLVGMVAGFVFACLAAPPALPRWRPQEIRELMSYGGPASLASFAWAAFRNGDYAIIGAKLGSAQAGFYWRAYHLAVEYQRKISIVMTQMAFPVLARAAGENEMLALRRRMVIVLTSVLFPLLALLVVLAPTVVPWLFGPQWEPAVVPTQILAGGGAAALVIDTVGSAVMAQGRAKALLGYGIAHFVVYAGAVVLVASRGLSAIAIAASVVHGIFLVVAYQLLMGGRGARALRACWDDLVAATTSCIALAGAAGAVTWLIGPDDVPTLVYLTAVSTAGGVAYLLVLRALFPSAFADLAAVIRRVIPARVLRRLGALGVQLWPRRPSSEAG